MPLLCFACIASSLVAQNVSQKDYRQFNIAVLNALDEYERTASFSERNDRMAFLNLFADANAECVYNDLIGSRDFQKKVSPQSYADFVPEDGSILVRYVLSDVRKEGDISVVNGLLHRKISFSKYIMIIDTSVYTEGEGGVLFDSSQAFGEEPDFRLLVDFVYDPSENKCLIADISPVEMKSPSPLDESRFSIVTQSSDKYDKQLTSGGKRLDFNEFNQAIAYYDDIDIDNPDVYVETSEYASGDRYNVLGLKFKPMYMRFKVYGDYSIGNAYDVKASNPGIKSNSSNLMFGADFGFESSLTNKWRMGLYAGMGFMLGKVNLSINNVQYDLEFPFNYIPKRSYRFDASEKLKLTDIVLPVYLENEFTLSNKLVLDLDLGARFYFNRKTELGPYVVSGTIGNSPVNTSFTAFVNPTVYNRSAYDIALFGSAELDYCIIRRLLYLYVSYGYEYGLKPSYDSGLNTYFNAQNHVFPFYYSPVADKDYPFRSLIGSVSYQRRSGWLSAGLKFKF